MSGKTGKKKILVADANEISLEIAKIMLKNDYEVITAKSGKMTLERLGHFRHRVIPDLILLDARIPSVEGAETLKKIKELAGSIPVLFSTALKDIERHNPAADIEADYIAKPYNQDDLLNKIKSALENVLPLPEKRRTG